MIAPGMLVLVTGLTSMAHAQSGSSGSRFEEARIDENQARLVAPVEAIKGAIALHGVMLVGRDKGRVQIFLPHAHVSGLHAQIDPGDLVVGGIGDEQLIELSELPHEKIAHRADWKAGCENPSL